MQTETAWSWRVEHIPQGTTAEQLKSFFVAADQSRIVIESLVPESTAPDLFIHAHASHYLTATISFRAQKGRKPQLIDELEGIVSLDSDFYGFTSLYSPAKEFIVADVIAVTGLAGHAFGSWVHSRTRFRNRMWLRDYLPKEILNIRVLIYGYPSELQKSESSISLFEHSNNFKETLLAIRHAAQCELRPIIFIGHSLGGLIIKRVVVDANRTQELLPVRSFIFLGVPHRGLEITALKTLVQGTSSETMINELKEGSSVLEILDHDFEQDFKRSPVRILTCYEQSRTSTVRKTSDGLFKRNGELVTMVSMARALLGYEEQKIGVNLDHSQIAKIDMGTNGPFLFIKQAVAQAVMENSEQLGSIGRVHKPRSGDAPLHRRVSATPVLKDDEESNTVLIPGLAKSLEQYKPLNETEGGKEPVTAIGPGPSLCLPCPVGEDVLINRAIYDSDVARVRRLLEDVHLNKRDSQGYTPLMVAAAADREQVVQDLIRRGASLKIKEPKGDTAFHLACRHAGVAVVSIFLKHAELLDIRGAEGRTPLMSSIQNPRVEIAKIVFDATEDVEASDENGITALDYAAMEKMTDVVRLLITDRGVNPNRTTTTNSTFTPLHYAAGNCHFEIIELLVQNGADCSTSTPEFDGARSAIHLVLLEPGLPRYRADCTKLLLRYGANIDQPDGAGRTALHWAVQHGGLGKVEWLISNKANLEAKTEDGLTPLHLAVEARHHEIANFLLNSGSNKDAGMESVTRKTALHIASGGNSIDLVKELLAWGATVDPRYLFSPDLRDPLYSFNLHCSFNLNCNFFSSDPEMTTNSGVTPLLMAIENGNMEIMELLLKAGASVRDDGFQEQSISFYTAVQKYSSLRMAVQKNNLGAIRILLEYNAPASTLFNYAAEAGNTSVMKDLLAKGVEADAECTDINHYPSLFIAASSGHVDAVKLLLDHGADPERKVEVQEVSFGEKKKWRAGEYFKPDVSEKNRRRIRAMLLQVPRGDNSRDRPT